MSARTGLIALGVLALAFATVPEFFEIYRAAAFDTVPRDDYAPYLLALVGESGEAPGAPFVYRIVSVAVAVPFYYLLPHFTFSQLQHVDPAYLRATQALSFVSYVSLILTAAVMFIVARRHFRASLVFSLVAGLASLLLASFIAKPGVDPFAILVISLLVLWQRNLVFFVPLILVSAGVNEKIPILFVVVLAARLLASLVEGRRFSERAQLVAAGLATIGYFAVVLVLRVPGNEHQLNPALILSGLQATLIHSLSLRGLVLNVFPVLVLAMVILAALRGRAPEERCFHPSDAVGAVALFVLALSADVVFNVGRIVMYSYPLYLPAAVYTFEVHTGSDRAQREAADGISDANAGPG